MHSTLTEHARCLHGPDWDGIAAELIRAAEALEGPAAKGTAGS